MKRQLDFSRVTLLDGAMGTELITAGLAPGACGEAVALERPEMLRAIHTRYLEAGSEIICANTFGANRLKLASYGLSVAACVRASVAVAKEAAAPFGALVALDVGPTGALLKPVGALGIAEATELFREVVAAGAEAGADVVSIETMTDLYEMVAAVRAAKDACDLPIFATMSFEESGRALMGASPLAAAAALQALGVAALGVNCSLGPRELLPVVRELARHTSLPLIAKPNAGLPCYDRGHTRYSVDAAAFCDAMADLVAAGAALIGGCCGSTPEFIDKLRAAYRGRPVARREGSRQSVFVGRAAAVAVEDIAVIGERINPTGRKALREAVQRGDFTALAREAALQAEAGASLLDVNVGVPGVDEPAAMRAAVEAVIAAADCPLVIDSANPEAIEAGLVAAGGKSIVNSVSGERKKLDAILPIARRYGAGVIALCVDDGGVPKSAGARVDIARRIIEAARAAGIPDCDILVDCLTLTAAAEPGGARDTLAAMREVRRLYPGVRLTLGVSNVSFGLPERERLSAAFLLLALDAGLDMPILNPLSEPMADAIRCYRALHGGAAAYAEHYAAQGGSKTTKPDTIAGEPPSLPRCIAQGDAEGAKAAALALAESVGVGLLDRYIVPALDMIGAAYQEGKLFLPQLIRSAEAAKAAADAVFAACGAAQSVRAGTKKILLATVRGDVHDIGKNIVAMMLKNAGAEVIDLGRDVPPERIAEAAKSHGADGVGLSALMTTTVPAMEESIRLLRAGGNAVPVAVGGAVVTEELARAIGADFYGRDAMSAVAFLRQIEGGALHSPGAERAD